MTAPQTTSITLAPTALLVIDMRMVSWRAMVYVRVATVSNRAFAGKLSEPGAILAGFPAM